MRRLKLLPNSNVKTKSLMSLWFLSNFRIRSFKRERMLVSWWPVLLRKFISGISRPKRSKTLSSAQLQRMNYILFMTVNPSKEIHTTQICSPIFMARGLMLLIWEILQRLLIRVLSFTLLNNWQILITTRSREILLPQSAKIAPLGSGIWGRLIKVFACMNTIAQTWCLNLLLATLHLVEHRECREPWTTKTPSTSSTNATGSTRSNTTNPTTSSFWAVTLPLSWTCTSSRQCLRLRALRCHLRRCSVKNMSIKCLNSTTSSPK